MMNNIDKQYQLLLQDILDNGVKKETRNGGTISVFGRQIRHDMKTGFPLLTTKKMAWKTMVTELIWFLRGDTNIKYLVDNNCNIWNGDAYKNYLKWFDEQCKLFKDHGIVREPWTKEQYIEQIKLGNVDAVSDLGPIYGKQWRSWGNFAPFHTVKGIDQITNLINDLKTNPDSRRLMVSSWNVGELDQMVLPPCHYGFQVYTRELSLDERCKIQIDRLDGMYSPEKDIFIKSSIDEVKLMTMDKNNIPTRAISLMFNMRSNDVPLGLPFNIASYALLLEIIGKIVNMVPDELIGNLGDCHIYLNQIEGVKEQIGRPYTPEERHELLKTAMGDFYQTAVDEQVPFGGGLSEYYESYKIPYHSREPFELPKLKLPKTDAFWKGFDVSLFGHLEPSDFKIDGYKSHSSIKMPLSN